MQVPSIVLADLGDLDPCQRAEEATSIGDREPRRLGIGGTPEAPQEPGPIRLEPLGGPGLMQPVTGDRRE